MTTGVYRGMIRASVKMITVMMVIFFGLVYVTGWGFSRLPTGFVPTEDQGYVFVNVQLPDAASKQRTVQVMKKLDEIFERTDGISDYVSISGNSILSGN